MNAQIKGILNALNGSTPCEGARSVPVTLDFSQAGSYTVDLTAQYQQKQFTTFQTIYAQNMSTSAPLIFQFSASGQTITIPPGFAGYLPVLSPDPFQFSVSLADALITAQNIQLINVYLPPVIWNTAP